MIVLGGNNVDIHVGVDAGVNLKKVICLHWSLFSPTSLSMFEIRYLKVVRLKKELQGEELHPEEVV